MYFVSRFLDGFEQIRRRHNFHPLEALKNSEIFIVKSGLDWPPFLDSRYFPRRCSPRHPVTVPLKQAHIDISGVSEPLELVLDLNLGYQSHPNSLQHSN